MLQDSRFWRSEGGASAAEFAMVLPVFIAMTLGVLNLCLLLFFNVNLHFAVDDAARCWSVKTTICTNAATAQSHALATFNFPSLSPSFQGTTVTCGNQVSGAATYPLNAVLVNIPVTLHATACFPIQD